MRVSLDRAQLEDAFAEIGTRALDDGRLVEISVYGGAALVLTMSSRVATRDVDAVVLNDAAWIRKVAAEIAERHSWPEAWLNDGVKDFLSAHDRSSDARHLFRTYPAEERPGLRVFLATPAYLFAMKCMAMRISGVDETQDRLDIEMLAPQLGIVTADDALRLVAQFIQRSTSAQRSNSESKKSLPLRRTVAEERRNGAKPPAG